MKNSVILEQIETLTLSDAGDDVVELIFVALGRDLAPLRALTVQQRTCGQIHELT